MNYLKLNTPIPHQGTFINAVRINELSRVSLESMKPSFTLGIANYSDDGNLTGFVEVQEFSPVIRGEPYDSRKGSLLLQLMQETFGALAEYQAAVSSQMDTQIEKAQQEADAIKAANELLGEGGTARPLRSIPVKSIIHHEMAGELVVDDATMALVTPAATKE